MGRNRASDSLREVKRAGSVSSVYPKVTHGISRAQPEMFDSSFIDRSNLCPHIGANRVRNAIVMLRCSLIHAPLKYARSASSVSSGDGSGARPSAAATDPIPSATVLRQPPRLGAFHLRTGLLVLVVLVVLHIFWKLVQVRWQSSTVRTVHVSPVFRNWSKLVWWNSCFPSPMMRWPDRRQMINSTTAGGGDFMWKWGGDFVASAGWKGGRRSVWREVSTCTAHRVLQVCLYSHPLHYDLEPSIYFDSAPIGQFMFERVKVLRMRGMCALQLSANFYPF